MNIQYIYIVTILIIIVLISLIDYQRKKLKAHVLVTRILCLVIIAVINRQLGYYNVWAGNLMAAIILIIMLSFLINKYNGYKKL